LIGNAVKFTQFRPDARIEIGTQPYEGEHVFFVKDNGAGFNSEYGHKLFGVFQRLHGTSEFEGLGIGLACAKRILTRMQGRLWAEGQEEKGACFYFALPR
jgi:light-regulated signal transduction histidine kinase (bacteriophytochrome)